MYKLQLVCLLLLCCSLAYTQNDIFLFKKRNKTIDVFTKGRYIAFQPDSKHWVTGNITRIQNDTFFIKPMIVRYGLMGTDTSHYDEQVYTFADVYAMPKKGVQVDYINNSWQVNRAAGHVHWYWVKSGWVFGVAATGYVALDAINGLIKNDFTFTGSKYGIAAASFLLGELLYLNYKWYWRMGKKYHFESLKVTNATETKFH